MYLYFWFRTIEFVNFKIIHVVELLATVKNVNNIDSVEYILQQTHFTLYISLKQFVVDP